MRFLAFKLLVLLALPSLAFAQAGRNCSSALTVGFGASYDDQIADGEEHWYFVFLPANTGMTVNVQPPLMTSNPPNVQVSLYLQQCDNLSRLTPHCSSLASVVNTTSGRIQSDRHSG